MSSQIGQLQRQVDDGVELMRLNIARIAECEDSFVEELEMRTLRLESQEEQFHVQTIDLSRKITMKVWKWKVSAIIIVIVIFALVILIVIVLTTSLYR